MVGPVNTCQVLPRLSVTPLMATGRLFHIDMVETNATKVEAPTELNAAVVCTVREVPLR